jgi:hypothetical protein
LVVATTSRPKLAAERAQPLYQPTLERGVHIFVLNCRYERARRDIDLEAVKRIDHLPELSVVEQASSVEHARVSA